MLAAWLAAAAPGRAEEPRRIADGLKVTIRATIRAPQEIIGEPDMELEYVQGSKGIFPALQTALAGKKAHDYFGVRLEPKDAYGTVRNFTNEIPVERLKDKGVDPAVGMLLSNGLAACKVTAIDAGVAKMDCVNPHAGKTIEIEGMVLSVGKPD